MILDKIRKPYSIFLTTKSNHNLVNITPFPCLTWLKRPYNRMFSRFEMFCCMLIWRRVTTAYMPT